MQVVRKYISLTNSRDQYDYFVSMNPYSNINDIKIKFLNFQVKYFMCKLNEQILNGETYVINIIYLSP